MSAAQTMIETKVDVWHKVSWWREVWSAVRRSAPRRARCGERLVDVVGVTQLPPGATVCSACTGGAR